MSSRKTPSLLVLATLVSLGVIATSAASAGTSPSLVSSGHSVTAVKSLTKTQSLSFSPKDWNWQDVPGLSTSIVVPANTNAILTLSFSAQSTCSGGSVATCQIRILVGGTEANPQADASVGEFPVFDTNPSNDGSAGDSWESHAMNRSTGTLPPGTYPVTVQWRVESNDLSNPAMFSLDFMDLTVQRVKA